MSAITQYQIDAFANHVFEGNPAAVCPLSRWLDDALLQAIATENNLSETAFFVATGGRFELRWFTPVAEVDLCGHATLASAFVLFELLGHAQPAITFSTRSGDLVVARRGDALAMDFPVRRARPCSPPPALLEGLRMQPLETMAADDYIAVLRNEREVRELQPDLEKFMHLDLRGVAVTARGAECDFVSRFFAPRHGIAEDPVTGSLHCALAPYWGERLGKTALRARQLSKRGGTIECELAGERVILCGKAVKFMEGRIELPELGVRS
jgi:predicted PhzF superfamily epimerase YddE/YHI9